MTAGLLLLVAFATVLPAKDIEVLNGRDLLKLVREKAGQTAKEAYEQRSKPTQPTPKTEPELVEEQPAEPAVELPIEEQVRPTKPLISETASRPTVKQPADKLLSMVPADSLFCLRVNNFEKTLGILDQFTAGASPVPMGVSMMVRMQLAQMLGSPELAGLNMRGNLLIFAQAEAGSSTEAEQEPDMFFCGLVPVTNYKQFISNPTCGEADAKGVSILTSQGTPPLLVKKTGRFAAISTAENYDKLLAFTESATNDSGKSLADTLDSSDIKAAKLSQLWFYCNMQSASQALGPAVSQQLAQTQMMLGAMSGGAPGQEKDQANPLAVMQGMDLAKLMKEIQSLSIAVKLKPNVLNITETVSALPETETAKSFSADSELFALVLPMLGAVRPDQMDAELKGHLSLIPGAGKADFVGSFNLLNSLKTMMPQMDIQAKSRIAFAFKFDPDKLTTQIAIPKEHLAELMKAQGMVQQQPGMDQEQMQKQSQKSNRQRRRDRQKNASAREKKKA